MPPPAGRSSAGTRRTNDLDGSLDHRRRRAGRRQQADRRPADRHAAGHAGQCDQDVAAAAARSDDAVSRRQLLGLKEVVPPKKFTVEKWTRQQRARHRDERRPDSRVARGLEPAAATPTAGGPRPQPTTSAAAASGVKPPSGVTSARRVVHASGERAAGRTELRRRLQRREATAM